MRNAHHWFRLDDGFRDVRYAWRGLRRQPAFVATTVLTLAVALGLVTVAFTVFNAYVLRPFAVRDPASLHQLGWRTQDAGGRQFRWRDYKLVAARADLFDSVLAEHTRFISSRGRALGAALVSDNYFEALAPPIALGRGLTAADAHAGNQVVVISHDLWTRIFASDPQALGRPLDLNGRSFTIAGIAGRAFTGLGDLPRDVWILASVYAPASAPELTGADQPRAFSVVGRLRPAVTSVQAGASLTPLMRDLVGADTALRVELTLHSSPNPLTLELVALLAPVFAAFALVLVTACANVSNVMLARAIARQRDIAVRLSIGATRAAIVRQLLAEGVVMAGLAGVVGLLLATWLVGGGVVLFFNTLPPSVAALVRLEPLALDHRVFLFALAIAAATTLAFALVPALEGSRFALVSSLRGQGGDVRRSSRLRSALVTAQVAVALVLVITAVTLAQNGAALGSLQVGYDTSGVVSINVRDERVDLIPRLAGALAADPRVAEFAVTGGNPLFIRTRRVAATAVPGATPIPTRYTFVSPAYFPLLRMPIAEGRNFDRREAQTGAPVAIVSQATAEALWPGEHAIGRVITIEPAAGRPVDDLPTYAAVTVVGVVPDVVSGLIVDGRDGGHIYLPADEHHARASAVLLRGNSRSDIIPETLQDILRPTRVDTELFEALPLEEMRQLQTYPFVAASWVGSFLSAVAVALSVSGLYGVLMFALTQRTREIGIRMALGATAGAVVKLVVGHSLRLAAIGSLIGAAIAAGVLRSLDAAIRLERVALMDGSTFAIAVLLIAVSVAAAAFAPARRATRIDPGRTLRAE